MAAESDIDRIVQDAFFRNTKSGVLVEVGAAHPEYLSISASFRKRGWTVIAVEPNPAFCALHRSMGYEILEYACSDANQDDVEFFVVDSNDQPYDGGNVSFESFSSLGIKDQFAELHDTVKSRTTTKTISVSVRTLDNLLGEHHPEIDEIDLLALDVEGWELNVMRGLSIERYRPKVVILENLFNDDRYRDFMREQGYGLWKTLSPNEIYIRPGMKADPLSSALGSSRRTMRAIGRKVIRALKRRP